MTVAIILAAHGSHISPNTAGVVWGYVDELRRRGVADEITACFWKEQPNFHQALDTIKSDTVVIVPMFTAIGFFSQQVIPAEMGLTGEITRIDNRTIHYTKTLGEHPALENIVQARVGDTLIDADLPHDDTAVVVIGHGTERSKTTRLTTQRQVEKIREMYIVSEVIDAYLDDDPDIPSIYKRTSAKNLIVIPFFLAEGSHATQDVPEALGIEYGEYPAQVNGRNVYYTPPIGTDDVIVDLIISLVEDAYSSEWQSTQNGHSGLWSHFPKSGNDDLIAAIENQSDPLVFGQLEITQDAVQPINSTHELTFKDAASLRQHVRENPFRSLTTSDDLPADWIVPVENIQQIPAIVETVYPATIADWAANRRGEFEASSFQEVIKRQQGMFQALVSVDNTTITHHVTSVCGRCIKHPTWHEKLTPTDRIPCAAPCNHFLSQLKEADK